MSTYLSRLRWAAIACSCAALLLFTPAAQGAASTGAELRVLNSAGQTLAQHVQYTGPTRVKTSPAATCFGQGTGGSGNAYRLGDANALGVVWDASRLSRKLRPMLITDEFSDDFGSLGLCGIGGFQNPDGFWYLKVNHEASTAGGDQTPLSHGDELLWYLIDDFDAPTPVELELKAQPRYRGDGPIRVRAFQYGDGGNRSRAAGVEIVGTGAVTDARGNAAVPAKGRVTTLQGVRDGAIPSNLVEACRAGRGCPPGEETQIHGTRSRDRIESTRGPDVIRAHGGRDLVDIRRSSNRKAAKVDCGRGKDVLVVRKGQRYRAQRCEQIRRG